MSAKSQLLTLTGGAGAIEAVLDAPTADVAPLGVAVLAHPHPLHAGTMHNKVVQTLARAFVQSGWQALRFNFRGVGASAGTHDRGEGECDDLLAVVAQMAPPGTPLALGGFSFGAFVAANAAARLWPSRPAERIVLVGTAASRNAVLPLPEAAHSRTLVVHGEHDDTVPLAAVLDWARPQALPVTVIPGGEHFFHGRLTPLKNLVIRHLRAPLG